jgi:hypothetical protein
MQSDSPPAPFVIGPWKLEGARFARSALRGSAAHLAAAGWGEPVEVATPAPRRTSSHVTARQEAPICIERPVPERYVADGGFGRPSRLTRRRADRRPFARRTALESGPETAKWDHPRRDFPVEGGSKSYQVAQLPGVLLASLRPYPPSVFRRRLATLGVRFAHPGTWIGPSRRRGGPHGCQPRETVSALRENQAEGSLPA